MLLAVAARILSADAAESLLSAVASMLSAAGSGLSAAAAPMLSAAAASALSVSAAMLLSAAAYMLYLVSVAPPPLVVHFQAHRYLSTCFRKPPCALELASALCLVSFEPSIRGSCSPCRLLQLQLQIV